MEFQRSKNVRIFGGAPENDERNYGQGFEVNSEQKRHGIYFASGLW